MTASGICVIGAGISGLAAARELNRAGIPVTVLEAGAYAGGAVRSVHRDGYLVETGPNSMLVNAFELALFLGELGLADAVVPAAPKASKRYIHKGGKLVAVPMGPGAFITSPLLSAKAKLRLLCEPLKRRPGGLVEESLACFIQRRLGREVLDYAINPMVAGIYAGDPARLSVQAAFPAIAGWEERHGSLFKGALRSRAEKRARGEIPFKSTLLSFRGGMGELVAALCRPLQDQLHLNSRLQAVNPVGDAGWQVAWESPSGGQREETFGAVIIAIPAHAIRQLPLPTAVADTLYPLGDIIHPPIASVVLGYAAADVAHPLDGFGYLVPQVEQREVLGTLFTSTLFPERAPEHHVSLTTFVGGRRQPELARLPEGELVARVAAEHRDTLGIRGQPVFQAVTVWPQSIPQYDVGHGAILDRAVRAEKDFPGLFLTGNYRGGIAVGPCLLHGRATGRRARAFYR